MPETDYLPQVDRIIVRHRPAHYDEQSGEVYCATDCPACWDACSLTEFYASFEEPS